MPIPRDRPMWRRLRAWLCWSSVEDMRLARVTAGQRFFRWLLYRSGFSHAELVEQAKRKVGKQGGGVIE